MEKLLKYHPHHKDYQGFWREFRPFITFTGTRFWKSNALNTDKYGLREQYDLDGEYIDFELLKKKYVSCNLLLGGSTAFGVDSTSDKTNISFNLNLPGCPCVNLSVPGAVSNQELASFLLYKNKFPKIKNIILFSGINNCTLSSITGSLFYPEQGTSVFYEDLMCKDLYFQYGLFTDSPSVRAKYKAIQFLEYWENRSDSFRWLLLKLFASKKDRLVKYKPMSFEEKFRIMNNSLASEIETWSWIQKSSGIKVHYVMQPVVGWTNKKLTTAEKECIDEYIELIPRVKEYANQDLYLRYKEFISANCKAHDINFADSNEWLNSGLYDEQTIFTDICHMTDVGYGVMANNISKILV